MVAICLGAGRKSRRTGFLLGTTAVTFAALVLPMLLRNLAFYGDPLSPLLERFRRSPQSRADLLRALPAHDGGRAQPRDPVSLSARPDGHHQAERVLDRARHRRAGVHSGAPCAGATPAPALGRAGRHRRRGRVGPAGGSLLSRAVLVGGRGGRRRRLDGDEASAAARPYPAGRCHRDLRAVGGGQPVPRRADARTPSCRPDAVGGGIHRGRVARPGAAAGRRVPGHRALLPVQPETVRGVRSGDVRQGQSRTRRRQHQGADRQIGGHPPGG